MYNVFFFVFFSSELFSFGKKKKISNGDRIYIQLNLSMEKKNWFSIDTYTI